jgi:hypothetical protein
LDDAETLGYACLFTITACSSRDRSILYCDTKKNQEIMAGKVRFSIDRGGTFTDIYAEVCSVSSSLVLVVHHDCRSLARRDTDFSSCSPSIQ